MSSDHRPAVMPGSGLPASPYWNPYLAGIGLGLVLLAAFVLVGRGLGASGAFSSTVAWLVNLVAPAHAQSNEYLQGYLGDGTTHPLKAWLVFEVLGVMAGALFSALLAGRARIAVEKGPRVSTANAAVVCICRRHPDGVRCTSGTRLHERAGPHRRRAAQRRQLGLHADGVRRRLLGRLVHALAVAVIMAPFYKYGFFGDEMSLVLAFVLGTGFGFFLERAGFGSARKLAAQFYLYDMSVFKVMFTAIVTAMLGVTYLGWLGWLDLSLVYLVPTHLVPQIVGGLVLGVGFVVGGYCPGTSVASLATGRIDGFVYAFGIGAGTLVYAEVFPWIKDFVNSNDMGQVTLPEVFDLPWGLLVFAVVLIAVAGFSAATFVERRIGDRS